MSKWRTIDSAPRDKEVLVLRRDNIMHIAKVSGHDKKYGILNNDFGDVSCMIFFPVGGDYEADDVPTHWQPLPTPPTKE